jgi:ABC-type transport system involved in cytochrome c biogenesis permease subunit
VVPADAQVWSDSIGGIYERGYAAAQMSIINPPAYVSIVRKHKLVYQLHYIALLPRGELREMGTKRDVLLLAKTGEPLALQLAKLLGDYDDFG